MELMWLQLKAIIWKNYITRKNHLILNVFEIVIPVMMYFAIAILVMYKDTIFDYYEYISTPTYVKERSSGEIYEQFRRDTVICFAPNNQFTVQLINKVQLKLNNTNVMPVSTVVDVITYYKLFKQDSSSVIGIYFPPLDNNTVPHDLRYYIMPGEHYVKWHLSELIGNQRKPYEPNSGSKVYFDQGLIALQMALDISYIEIVSSKDLPYAISMQEFPYPPHSRDYIQPFVYSLYALCTSLSFMLLCPALITLIVEERGTGLKDLMKTTGLQSWIFWLGWFLYAFAVNFLAVSIITIIITTERWASKFAAFQHCDWSLFFVFLLLFCAAGIMFCFAISVFFYNPKIAALTGTIMWLISFIVSISVTTNPNRRWISKLLLALMPNRALVRGFQIIRIYEQRDIDLNWSYFFKSFGYTDVSMGHVFGFLLLDIIIYLLLTIYVDNVIPGPHALAKPYHFPVSYIWNKLKRNNRVQNIEESVIGYSKTEPVRNLNTIIQIQNLYRNYGKVIAINDLSMDIYEGEVTVLLGHKDAGKTTLLSIITGRFGVSSGKVLINNWDIKHDFNKVRDLIGFSPQQNWYFGSFTLLDSLKFFGMSKGLSLKQAKEDGYNILRYMKMHNQCDAKVSQLPTILQRKLSLAIALTGYPKILILDEPTIGLDPEGRREIWDMLISMKDFYTIIIATNLMEEAHLLGDRIAIIDRGRLMCYGTPNYIKLEYGAGYHLQLTRQLNSSSAQLESISKIVNKTIPTANMQYCSDNHIVYLLPYEMKPKFSNILELLESKKMILGIKDISMSVTTLQEVFLSIGDTTDKRDFTAYSASTTSDSGSAAVSSIFNFITDTTPKCRGVKLFMLQLWSLFKKRWYFARRNLLSFLLLALLMFFLGFAVLYLTNPSNQVLSVNQNVLYFKLSTYGETTVVYATNATRYEQDEDLKKIIRKYKNLVLSERSKIKNVPCVPKEILKNEMGYIIHHPLAMVIGAEFNTSNNTKIINAMYSNYAFHAAPISLNLIMKALLRNIMGDEYSISASMVPFTNVKSKLLDDDDDNLEWIIIFPLGILLFLSVFFFFPCMEQVFKVKQLQLSCGVHSALYWLICYIFDIILYMISVILLMLLMHGFYAATSTIHFGEKHYCALLVIFSTFGLSILPLIYLLSYKKTTRGAYALFLITGLVSTITVLCIEIIRVKLYSQDNIHIKRANYVFCMFPPFGLSYTLAQFAKLTIKNYYFDITKIKHKISICRYITYISPCCDDEKSAICIDRRSYFGKNDYSIFWHVIIMLCSSVIYFTILLLLETHFVHKYYEIFQLWYSTKSQVTTDEKAGRQPNKDISTEMKRISDILKQEKQKNQTEVSDYISEDALLLVHKLEKSYGIQKVVKSISFRVESGDCFGILAVKGAGKTPILRILAGHLPLIFGEARILTRARKKVYLSKERKSFLKNLGYCPKFDSLNEVLTGREMLQLFAELRGVCKRAPYEVNKYITAFGLDECADTPCGNYSDTNKRKLNVAIALIGEPLLVMLDEPTKGMDPISRRQLWDILCSFQNQEAQSTVILASHNMEECTALCNKLAIVKDGQLEYYGNINDLQNKYGRGFTVFLKVNTNLSIINRSLISGTTGLLGSSPKILASRSQSISRDHSGSVKFSGSLLKPRTSSNDPPAVMSLMLAFENKYGKFCTLVDKHVGLLHYHINKATRWSVMFSEMEALKLQHPIIEDYSISETTLEEVFLSMVRIEEHKQTKHVY